eukprot:CAMPEP_0117419672 /NCGR_PEP_ID=MMETSP0758-20121206/1182_1 /TAXON_ID=63605 /ORGANISM="Percolomonas cosmopolitus, Strain AE-1 (ATCC 50343)" /LENGTH=204 /DNA_ID=CAMNT_0005200867 /DNA_START=1112 /DNA_END=1723 /DNA_ORIENTATION=+
MKSSPRSLLSQSLTTDALMQNAPKMVVKKKKRSASVEKKRKTSPKTNLSSSSSSNNHRYMNHSNSSSTSPSLIIYSRNQQKKSSRGYRYDNSPKPMSSDKLFQVRNARNQPSTTNEINSILTSNAIGGAPKKARRPRSAAMRKRKPTPMHQRPSSAPSQNNDRLSNIYGRSSRKSTTHKKKTRRSKKTPDYQNVSSRLYNPTLS